MLARPRISMIRMSNNVKNIVPQFPDVYLPRKYSCIMHVTASSPQCGKRTALSRTVCKQKAIDVRIQKKLYMCTSYSQPARVRSLLRFLRRSTFAVLFSIFTHHMSLRLVLSFVNLVPGHYACFDGSGTSSKYTNRGAVEDLTWLLDDI